jgi:uncharacterized protein
MGAAQVVLVAVAVFTSAAVQSTTGFGFALLAVPLMAIVIPAEEAVVLSGAFSLLTASTQAITQRAHAVRPVAGRMLLGALIGAPVGLAILTVTTGRQLRFFLAGVIFAFLVLTLRGFTLHRAGRAVDLGAGVVAGVLGYLVGSRLRRRFDTAAFRRLTLWLLGLTGVVTLVGALFA